MSAFEMDEIDQATLARAQRGDEDARQALVAHYESLVASVLGQKLGAGHDALVEEMTRATFAQVFSALEAFSRLGPVRLSAWIATLAARRAAAALARDEGKTPGPAESPRPAPEPKDEAHVRSGGLWLGPGSSRGTVISAVVVGTACIIALVVALRRGNELPAEGHVRPDARTSITLGRHGAVVIEPGADIGWRMAPGGAATVEHSAGEAFYRVNDTMAFAVKTPLGTISVTGTCFRVELLPASERAPHGTAPHALVVTVLEGQVLVTNVHGMRAAGPGEIVMVSGPDAPPALAASPDERPPRELRGAQDGASRPLAP